MSIADRISSMASNLSSAYGRIEYLGVDTSSIDKNLQNLSNVLDTVYNDYPKVSDEGISPSIDGSRVGRLKSTLKASDTTQFTTTGKNLLDSSKIVVGTKEGITCTYNNETQEITFNGTCTKDNTSFAFKNFTFNTTANTTQFIVYYVNGTVSGYCTLRFYTANYGSGSETMSLLDLETELQKSETFTQSVTLTPNSSIRFDNGTVANNFTIKIMLTNSEDTTYEPYTNGASPNPDYPQDIHVVKGNNTVEVCGIQLFDKDNYNIKSLSATTTSTGGTGTYAAASNQKHIYIPCQPNTDYVIIKDVSNISVLGIYETQSEPAVGVGYTTLYYSSTSLGKIHVKTGNTAQYLDVRINTQGITTEEINTIANTLIIAKGTNPEAYPTNLPEGLELCKISTYQDKLFKAISGDTIYDSLTAEQKEGLVSGGWYKYGEAKKANTSDITRAVSVTSTIGNDLYAYACNISTNINTDATLGIVKSNIFAPKILGTTSDTADPNNVRFNMGISKHNNTQQIVISIKKSYLTTGTPEDFISFLTNNNFYCLYVLATPTITQITDTTLISQLENLYSAMSKNGQTNVLQTNADNPFIIYASALKGE